jgi:hypothetical protein
METVFWLIVIIGSAAGVFAILAGLAELCEWLADHD